MGIQGLIPFLKDSSQNTNIRTFSGSTVAIDAYCWLHKGAFGCADKLAKGEPTDLYVTYCVKRINTLLSFGIKPIMVFDGQRLPSKAETEAKRRDNREKNRKNAKIFLQEGKLKEARECFQRCVDVTPEMAHRVILACKELGVDCIVAPYEADAQLAYLNLEGIAQIIITEDSDLILFGCEKVFFKMDSEGNGVLFEKNKINKSLGAKATNFTFEKFRYACIMSGCDYLSSLHGIGLVKAVKFFSLITNPDVKFALKKIPSYLKMPQLANLVTTEYIEGFIRANNTFLYQLVFCPVKRKLVPLNPYPDSVDSKSLDYAGKYYDGDLALKIAMGKINYQTKQPFSAALTFGDNYKGLKKCKFPSIWDKNYKPKSYSCQEKTEVVNTSTKGKVMVANLGSIMTRNKSPKKRPLEAQNPILEQCPTEENLQILKLYSSVKNITPTKRRRTINEEESGWMDSPNNVDLNDSGIGTSQSSVDTTPKRSVINNVDKRSDKIKLISSRFFNKAPIKQGPTSIFDEIQKDSSKTSSIFDAIEIEPVTNKSVSILDEIEKTSSVIKDKFSIPTRTFDGFEKESGTSKKPSIFDEFEKESGTKKPSIFDELEKESGTSKKPSIFNEIEKESVTSKKPSIFDEFEKDTATVKKLSVFDEIERDCTSVFHESEKESQTSRIFNKPSVFDEFESESSQPKEDIKSKLNKFAWKPSIDENKPRINATAASRSSFKAPKIISKTPHVIELSDDEITKETSPIKKLSPVIRTRSSCRISGLSKKQKIVKDNPTTSRQLRLTDMLNNFRYKK